MDYINRNLTMMTDYYQLTMMNSYFKRGMHERMSVFDVFFRKTSTYVSYSICAGLEQVVDYIRNFRFTQEDIGYLASLKAFDPAFLDYLERLRFTGDIDAIPEGTPVFPSEPLLRVKAPLCQAQLIETAILNMINFQTLIASKASYIMAACKGDSVMEFGLRRAQGPDAGFFGSRACYIAGCNGTSNVLAGEVLGIPVKGTHSHSYVMSFPDELSAFRNYAAEYPDGCMLLVDTYNTLKSGVPNAITVFRELEERGHKPVGIRIDSGDLAYLSKEARKMLDEAGFSDCVICASGDLDEETIYDLKSQGARIDSWGVGTRMITGWETPALGGVYKMSAMEEEGRLAPKIKISDNMEKTTNPGIKKVYRLFGRQNGMAIADLIALDEEELDDTQPLRIYHPVETWKSMVVEDFTVEELFTPVFRGGKLVMDMPSLDQIREKCRRELDRFWDEYKRNTKPQKYKVDLSDRLYDLKKGFLCHNV